VLLQNLKLQQVKLLRKLLEVKNKDLITEMKAPKRAKLSTSSSDSRQQTGKRVDQDANLEWVCIFNVVLSHHFLALPRIFENHRSAESYLAMKLQRYV